MGVFKPVGVNEATGQSQIVKSGDTLTVDFITAAGVITPVVSAIADILSPSVTFSGNLTVIGNLAVCGETANIASNHLYLNKGYVATVAQAGGLVVNRLSTATTSTTTTGGFEDPTTVNVLNGTALAAGDIIEITGADIISGNNKLFEIASVDTSGDPDKITIDPTPTLGFSALAFNPDPFDTSAVLTKIDVAVLQVDVNGNWEAGKGSDVTAVTLSLKDLILEGSDPTFNLANFGTGASAVATGDIGAEDGGGNALLYKANVGTLTLTGPGNGLTLGTTTITEGASTIEVAGLPIPQVLSQTASIDLTTLADTALYTVPSGQSAVIVAVIVRPTTATAANGDSAVSVGTNSSTFDDIIPNTSLTTLDAITESYTLDVGGISHIATAAEVIRFQVDTVDTGTALTATVDLVGYLI